MTPKAHKALTQAAKPEGLRIKDVHGNTINGLVDAGLAKYALRFSPKYRIPIHVIEATEDGLRALAPHRSGQ